MATKTVTLIGTCSSAFQNAGGGSGPLVTNPGYVASHNAAFKQPPLVSADQAAVATVLSGSQTGSSSAGTGKYLGVDFVAFVKVFADSADGLADYNQFSRSAALRNLLVTTDWTVA